jgi:hypothetical protein
MPATKKTFDLVEPIFYDLANEDNKLIYNEFNTAQGMDLVSYSIFKNINDKKIKNNTVNILTEEKVLNDVIGFDSDDNLTKIDLNSYIFFDGNNVNPPSRALTTTQNSSAAASPVSLSPYSSGAGQNFNIDFVDDTYVQISFFDGIYNKLLNVNNDITSGEHKKITFESISPGTSAHAFSGYKFLYNYDQTNNFLTLYQNVHVTVGRQFHVVAALSATTGPELSAQPPTRDNLDKAVIKLSSGLNKVSRNNLNNFNFYEVLSGDYNISNTSVSGIKSNLLTYYPYEATTLSGSKITGRKLFNVLNYFDLKNHISNNNFVNSTLPFDIPTKQRSYTTILNENNTSESKENLLFNYNFYTKEYLFSPDKITKFKLPSNLYPYERINIEDTNLTNNGSYASLSPYFSDKIYKEMDSNRNTTKSLELEDIIVDQSNFPITLQNNENLLKLQSTFIKPNNNASFVCSWLSGSIDNKGRWYDRYYFSTPNEYTENKLGIPNEIFNNLRDANNYFIKNGIQNTFFDVESNLIFAPENTLFYQRIGNNYINNTINNFDNHLIKSTLTNKFSGEEVDGLDKLNFDEYCYDDIKIDEDLDSNIFNITFDLNLDSPTSLDSYQIIGNKYEDGFSLRNNFYFTPFCIMHEDNKIYAYDSNFNLVQENIYPTINRIKDVLYLEQQSNFVIVTEDSIVKTSITGEILDENKVTDADLITDVGNILSGYHSRYFHDYNKVVFNLSANNFFDPAKGNIPVILDLNTLAVSAFVDSTGAPSHLETPALSSFKNILKPKDKGFVGVDGINPVLLDGSIVASISTQFADTGNDLIIFTNIDDNTEVFNPIRAYTSKIYSIASYKKKLYIQSFSHTGEGKISVYSSERELLTSFSLSAESVSGVYLDFIEDDRQVKLLSISRKNDKKLVIDKINLDNYSKETYFLNISGADTPLSNNRFISPVNFQYIDNKYKDVQNKLCFQFCIDNFIKSLYIDPQWQENNPDSWNNPGTVYAPWDSSILDIEAKSVEETIFPLPYVNLNNTISIDFNIPAGTINLYLNGEMVKKFTFDSNIIPNTRILFPNVFINIPNLFRDTISKFIDSNQFYGRGGNISNLRVYNTLANPSLAQYLYLKDKKIDPLNLDVPCGTRNNIEEVDNLYSYILPGRKNNNMKVYIKNAFMDSLTQETVEKYLKEALPTQLPTNVDFVDFNFDINI